MMYYAAFMIYWQIIMAKNAKYGIIFYLKRFNFRKDY
jgi:hypothetical protein